MTNIKKTVNVWDWFVRIGHWTLVLAFFTAYLTEDDFLTLHVWAGYVVGIYVSLRILWGFVGSRYARFSSFLYAPAKIISYLHNLKAGLPQHYIGHNPAGGAMVMALLLSLSITTVTGLKLYAVEENEGPFAFMEQAADQFLAVSNPIAVANAESDDEYEEKQGKQRKKQSQEEKFWEEFHEIFANFTLLLVFIHIAGVVISSRIDKENLVKTMLTGKKEVDDTYQ